MTRLSCHTGRHALSSRQNPIGWDKLRYLYQERTYTCKISNLDTKSGRTRGMRQIFPYYNIGFRSWCRPPCLGDNQMPEQLELRGVAAPFPLQQARRLLPWPLP